MDHHRISERAAWRVSDGLEELRASYSDDALLTGDLDVMVAAFVDALPRERWETIGKSRCGQPYRRAGRDFRLYRAMGGQ